MKRNSVRTPNCIFLIIAVVLSSCLSGCTHIGGISPRRIDPGASSFLAHLKQQRNNLESFKATGKLKITDKGKNQTMRLAWIGSQPGNLRVEVLGPWIQPTLVLVLKGGTFCVYDYKDNRHYTGKSSPRNLSRFLSIPVSATDLFSLMSGHAPIFPFHEARLRVSKENGNWYLCLYNKWERLVEKMWLKDDRKTVEKVEVFDGWDNLKYTVIFNRFERAQGFTVPHEMMISEAGGTVFSLQVGKFWTNVPIPRGAYTLKVLGADC